MKSALIIFLIFLSACSNHKEQRTPASLDISNLEKSINLYRKISLKDEVIDLEKRLSISNLNKDLFVYSAPIEYKFKILTRKSCFELASLYSSQQRFPFGEVSNFSNRKKLECFEVSVDILNETQANQIGSILKKQIIYMDETRKIYSVYDYVKKSNVSDQFVISKREIDSINNSISLAYLSPIDIILSQFDQNDLFSGNINDYIDDEFVELGTSKNLLSLSCPRFSFANTGSKVNIYCQDKLIPDFIRTNQYIAVLKRETE